uniref:Uncharacterized protein n=1 Tax=Anguilla anguilla TaxID=7936 RepID=A0A0E9XAE6_ANGAN
MQLKTCSLSLYIVGYLTSYFFLAPPTFIARYDNMIQL